MDLLQKISEELQKGNYQGMPNLVQEALNLRIPPSKIMSDGLVAGMDVVGARFYFQPGDQMGMDVRPVGGVGAKLGKILAHGRGDLHALERTWGYFLKEG
jgi:hypothetical protein